MKATQYIVLIPKNALRLHFISYIIQITYFPIRTQNQGEQFSFKVMICERIMQPYTYTAIRI